jgi:hypothetical protein
VLGLIILLYFLSALSEYSNSDSLEFVHFLENFLAFYLLAEFIVRIWAVSNSPPNIIPHFWVGADAHFHDLRGRFAFLCRPICLIDLIVLGASFFLLFSSSNSNSNEAVTQL